MLRTKEIPPSEEELAELRAAPKGLRYFVSDISVTDHAAEAGEPGIAGRLLTRMADPELASMSAGQRIRSRGSPCSA
jgi:hypothetical protein